MAFFFLADTATVCKLITDTVLTFFITTKRNEKKKLI
jgi:hypothetical protein